MSQPKSSSEVLARLPSVDRLLRSPAAEALIASHGRQLVRDAIRTVLQAKRQQIPAPTAPTPEALLGDAEDIILQLKAPPLKPVYNMTGTVLHTNLGRALLPESAVTAMVTVARDACNLEYDLKRGRRGDRDDLIEALVCRLTGAEAATVVNNNAAAVLLVLNSLAARRRVLVSRGELVEIGGSFRIPDIMQRAGTKLVEVGTTNRTHAQDFTEALHTPAAAIMQVHTSNYAIQGFTKSVAAAELSALAKQHQIPFLVDLGSGTLVDLEAYGLPHEPTVADILGHGADVVTFSGDKLLGGPQAGIIAGRHDLVKRIKKNPMRRALRVDKLRLAALIAVLQLYLSPEHLATQLPALQHMVIGPSDLMARATALQPVLQQMLNPHFQVTIVETHSQIGSGALPVDLLPSVALVLTPAAGKAKKSRVLTQLQAALRALPRPVIGRVQEDKIWLDVRTLAAGDVALQAFQSNLGGLGAKTGTWG